MRTLVSVDLSGRRRRRKPNAAELVQLRRPEHAPNLYILRLDGLETLNQRLHPCTVTRHHLDFLLEIGDARRPGSQVPPTPSHDCDREAKQGHDASDSAKSTVRDVKGPSVFATLGNEDDAEFAPRARRAHPTTSLTDLPVIRSKRRSKSSGPWYCTSIDPFPDRPGFT